jgi:hypothetical protein
MIYDDHNFLYYMSKQIIPDEKQKSMDRLFHKSRLIKETFYNKESPECENVNLEFIL